MSLVGLARLLAGAWGLVSLGVFVLMLNGFKPLHAVLLAIWIALPLPLAAWIGGRLSTTTAARIALAAGLAAAFVFGAWAYWDAFIGRASREESLAGVAALIVPLYQTATLIVTVLVAWFLSREIP